MMGRRRAALGDRIPHCLDTCGRVVPGVLTRAVWGAASKAALTRSTCHRRTEDNRTARGAVANSTEVTLSLPSRTLVTGVVPRHSWPTERQATT